MPSIVAHDACKDIGLLVGYTCESNFAVKTGSHVTLAELRNQCLQDQDLLRVALAMIETRATVHVPSI